MRYARERNALVSGQSSIATASPRRPRRGTLRPELSRRRTRWPGMPATHFFCLFALVRREHRIELAASAGDDRIHLRLHFASYCSKLVTLPIHDRVDEGLLFRRQAELVGESPAEIAVAG